MFLGREADQRLARTLSVCLCGLLLSISVCGLDRDRTITQFYHTAWTAKDGAPSQITSLTQTMTDTCGLALDQVVSV